LVTVHGPLQPEVPLAALRTARCGARMESGRLRPTSPFALTYAIVSTIARREAEMVAEITAEVGLLEQRVMSEANKDPQRSSASCLRRDMSCWRSRPWPNRAARSIDGRSS
jgi:Mg2+ and Co2+ transporter CorA